MRICSTEKRYPIEDWFHPLIGAAETAQWSLNGLYFSVKSILPSS
jgi:hypothetical protein